MGVVLILLPHALREGSSSQALLGFTLKDTNSLLCLPGLASFHFFFPALFLISSPREHGLVSLEMDQHLNLL